MIPAGFEPATVRLEGECSIQLSYGTLTILFYIKQSTLSIGKFSKYAVEFFRMPCTAFFEEN